LDLSRQPCAGGFVFGLDRDERSLTLLPSAS
jgi:hypothetical protein